MTKAHSLKYERELRGWSQEKVAEVVGTTARTVSRWERGLSSPYPYYREKLCALFGKNAFELGLLTETDEQEEAPSPVPPSIHQEPEATEKALAIYDPMMPITPGRASSLIGRSALLTQMKQRLFAGGSLALTAINGLPGVGKTTLAVALASDREVQTKFHDGILWAGLGTSPDIVGLFTHWGVLLGISPDEVGNVSDRHAWGIALRKAIGRRHMLLIIDDAWKAEDALALRVGGPNCAYLVTTRIPPIAFLFAEDGAITVPELDDADGLALLQSLTPEVVAQYPEDALALVRAVGALPLALTLLGKYLSTQSLSRQPRRLLAAINHMQDTKQRMSVSMLTLPLERSPGLSATIPLSLYTAIEISDQQLNPLAREALRALSVLPAKPLSFSENAALAVSGKSVNELDELSDAGLLEVGNDNQYMLHQTISDYAHIHLEEKHASERLILYATEYVGTYATDYKALEQEQSTLLAALDAASTTGDFTHLVQNVHTLVPFLLTRGLYATAERYLQKIYKLARGSGEMRVADIVETLLFLGEIEREQGNHACAEQYLQEGLKLAQQEALLMQQSTLLKAMGWLTHEQGKSSKAEQYFQEALLIAQQESLPEQQCESLAGLGAVTRAQGRYAQAEHYLHAGLSIAHQIGHAERASSLLLNLAVVASIRGNNTLAEQHLQEGLLLARQLGHRERISTMLSNLGAIATTQGQYAQAEQYLQEGLSIALLIGHRERMSMLYLNLAGVAIHQEKYESAERYLQDGLTLAHQIEKPRLISLFHSEWGELHLKRHELTEAANEFSTMLNSMPETNQELLPLAQYGYARALAAQGNLQAAKEQAESSLALFTASGDSRADDVRAFLNGLPQRPEISSSNEER